MSTASALADQALELALREGNPTTLAYLYNLQQAVRFWSGDLAGAEHSFTTGLRFFDEPGFRQAPSRAAAIGAFAYGARTAWMLGRSVVARERLAQMMAVPNPNNPHDLVFAWHHAAGDWLRMGEYERAEALAARALELSEKHQFPNEAAMSQPSLGLARAMLGRTTEGIALIRQGVAGVLKSGQRVAMTHYSTCLAAAQLHAGAISDALETVEHALNFNPEELAHRPETLRIRGELRLKQRKMELAEADFREAIALAQKMSAKAWELRASTSLARLLRDSGRRAEAHAILAEVYGWFTEGFDTADLREAKALLDELER